MTRKEKMFINLHPMVEFLRLRAGLKLRVKGNYENSFAFDEDSRAELCTLIQCIVLTQPRMYAVLNKRSFDYCLNCNNSHCQLRSQDLSLSFLKWQWE